MRTKYDVTLNKDERKELINIMKQINDYLIDLVKDFDANIELEGQWDYYETNWGTHKCKIEIEKRFNNVVVATNKVERKESYNVGGAVGGLGVCFERDLLKEDFTMSYQQYALSLIDNWNGVKAQILSQLEQAKKTRALTKGFKLL